MDDELLKFAQWLHDAGYLASPYDSDDSTSDNSQALVSEFRAS
jgi:hypothetical protein